MEADIVCVGFGPAAGGFLTTLGRVLAGADGTPALESRVLPGLPLQVLCYERADDIGFGVSGVVTAGRALRASFPGFDPARVPMAAEVSGERTVYLLDPVGASRRPWPMRAADGVLRALRGVLPWFRHEALELPWAPAFLHKRGGLVMSIGQFSQWVGQQVMAAGVQVWPGSPVARAVVEGGAVVGVQLCDQGVGRNGEPGPGFMPGVEVRAPLTVVADGPVGAVGRQLDEEFGMPEGHHARDWALGMKFVVDLPEGCELATGTVLHTFGFPEPEIFGFLYVHPERVASLGIFVPSWFDNPVRTAYRYLQHWMLHPYLWRHLKGGRLRSWGAKSLQESGIRGEPLLAGDGFARIGEGSGATNVLLNSGLDEAWATGVQLAEAVIELARAGKPFDRANLEAAYVRRRRASWVEREARVARRARDGFQRGIIPGMIGMLLAGLTNGRLALPGRARPPHARVGPVEDYFRGRIPADEVARLRGECLARGTALHDALMTRAGWPAVPLDGGLLVSHQDALLLGGKVQAAEGFADHVAFVLPAECEACGSRICVEMCSGEAIRPGPGGRPLFEREKCIHCGACLWNCEKAHPDNPERSRVEFTAGAGGLHSAEN